MTTASTRRRIPPPNVSRNGAWPEADRRACRPLFRRAIYLMPLHGRRMEAGTQHKVATAYGRRLTSLDRAGLLDPDLHQPSGSRGENLARYMAIWNWPKCSLYGLGRVRDIANAMKAMAPEHDWSWLYRVIRRLRPERRYPCATSSTRRSLGRALCLWLEDDHRGRGASRRFAPGPCCHLPQRADDRLSWPLGRSAGQFLHRSRSFAI